MEDVECVGCGFELEVEPPLVEPYGRMTAAAQPHAYIAVDTRSRFTPTAPKLPVPAAEAMNRNQFVRGSTSVPGTTMGLPYVYSRSFERTRGVLRSPPRSAPTTQRANMRLTDQPDWPTSTGHAGDAPTSDVSGSTTTTSRIGQALDLKLLLRTVAEVSCPVEVAAER